MQIKEIYVEAKRSKNFQTYTVGTLVTVNAEMTDEEYANTVIAYQKKVNKLAQDQFA